MKNSDFKKCYYSNGDVVTDYENHRFRGAGGEYVNTRELEAVKTFLDQESTESILDMPIGTGRLYPVLSAIGFDNIYGADYSEAMLKYVNEHYPNKVTCLKEDALNSSFKDEQFVNVISMRFTFHCNDIRALLTELKRITSSGGCIVLDTLTWSPRQWSKRISTKFGGDIFTISNQDFMALCEDLGLEVDRLERMFLLPSYFYVYIPRPLLKLFTWIEKILGGRLCSKTFWKLRKK